MPVSEPVRVPHNNEGYILVGQDPESFRRRAHMVGPRPPVETCAGSDTVELLAHAPDRLAILAEMACDGMVVPSAFYPGWRARVDHRPAEMQQVNGAIHGVAVPRGRYTVTMRYRPVSVYLGAALTLLGILGALGWAAFGLRPPGRAPERYILRA